MACQDARSDSEILAQFWTDWGASVDHVMLTVTELVCQQEQLVRQVLARCPQRDDTKDGEPSRGLVIWSASGRRVGETLPTATCLETCALSSGKPFGSQVAEVARPEPTDKSREKLVRQVLAICPQRDDIKEGGAFRNFVMGRAHVERPLRGQAGSPRDAALVWIGADLSEGMGRCGGEALAALPCLLTGALSCGEPSGAQAAEGDDAKDGEAPCDLPIGSACVKPSRSEQARDAALVWIGGNLGGCKWRRGGEALATATCSVPTAESREKANWLTTRTLTMPRRDQLKALHQRRTDNQEERWEAIDAWQSRYDELTGEFMRQQRGERSIPVAVANVLPVRVLQLADWWFQLEEPPRRGILNKIVSHRAFNDAIGILIVMNTVFAVYLSDYGITNVGQAAPNETAVEGAFLFFFALEICLKIWVHKLYFFCNDDMLWSMFDFFLVVISVVDVSATLAAKSGEGSNKMNMTFARVLRIFKVGRILRMFRAVKFLNKFRVILTSIVQSFSTFGWSVMVMTMICFTFSLLFVQQIGGFTSDVINTGSLNEELWAAQQKHFGSVGRGTFTLLMVAMGGADWALVKDLIEPLGLLCNAAFIFFVIFFNFALMNILAGMFLDTVVQLNKPDNEEQITVAWEEQAANLAELTRIVEAMDVLHSGAITKEAFVKYCNFPLIQLCFAKVGIDVGHPDHFFSAAADAAESVGVQEFVEGAMRMKGSATNVDIQRLVFEVRSLMSPNEARRVPFASI